MDICARRAHGLYIFIELTGLYLARSEIEPAAPARAAARRGVPWMSLMPPLLPYVAAAASGELYLQVDQSCVAWPARENDTQLCVRGSERCSGPWF